MTTDNAPEDANRPRLEWKLIPCDDELRAIYDGLLDGLLIADAETKRFIKTNAAMCRMLGYTEREVLSLSVRDIHPSSVQEEILRRFEAAAQGHLQTAENVLLLKKGGEKLWADIGISLLNYQDRLCLVGLFHEITNRKIMEEILKQSHEELEIRVEERTRELAHAVKKQNEYSERLRGMAAELAKTEQRERQRLAKVLHDGLQQHLVASIYQLELINGSQNPQVEMDQLRELLKESIETARALAAELSPPVLLRRDLNSALMWLIDWKRKKHGLDTVLTGDIGSLQLSEEILLFLFEATRELLLNVVKHSGTKKADVILQQQDGRILMTVRDNGKGFNPGDVLADAHHAAGSGLFQIRERVSLMGGNMEIESSPGHGCRFRIFFPLLKETEGTVPESIEGKVQAGTVTGPETNAQTDEEKMKIRIVLADDHMVVRRGLANLISRVPDFEIIGEAANGKEAVDLVRELHPDVVLMDINMPQMDGIEATRIIRSEHKDVHVIGFSMYQEESFQKAILEAGADAYITKQGASRDLIHAIRSCCKQN